MLFCSSEIDHIFISYHVSLDLSKINNGVIVMVEAIYCGLHQWLVGYACKPGDAKSVYVN
jgi:hypothetical protein